MMRKRVLIYDLHHKDSNDYKELYKLLDQFKAVRLNESAYIITTDLSQQTIIKEIRKTIKEDDSFYFVSVDINNKLFCLKV